MPLPENRWKGVFRRRIGDVQVAVQPRPADYVMPPLLLFSGAVLNLYPSTALLSVAVVLATCVALQLLYELVTRPKSIRLSWVVVEALLLGYGVGTLYSTVATWMASGDSLPQFFNRPAAQFCSAFAVVTYVAAMLFIVGYFEKPSFAGLALGPAGARERRLVYVGVAVLLAAVFRGQVGYMGPAQSVGHHVSPLGDLAALINPPLAAFAAYVFVKSKMVVHRVILGAAFTATLLCLVPQGRRPLMFALLLVVMAVAMAGVRFRKLSLKLWLLIAVGITVLYVSAAFFLTLRESVGGLSKWGQHKYSLFEYTSDAVEHLAGESGRTDAAYRLTTNLQQRTFILGYFSDLLAASWYVTPLHGDVAAYSFKVMIPSVLYPDKSHVLQITMEEAIANPRFGLAVLDAPNSIVTSGVSDFGIYGVFLYPLLLVAAYKLFCNMTLKVLCNPLQIFLALFVVSVLIQTESTLCSYFVCLRDAAIVITAAATVWKVPTFEFRTADRHAPGLVPRPGGPVRTMGAQTTPLA